MFSSSDRDRSPAEREMLGIVRVAKPAPPVAKAGKRFEARNMLKDIYDWFTEGFETLDLKRAGALLAELSQPHFKTTQPPVATRIMVPLNLKSSRIPILPRAKRECDTLN